MGVTVVLLVAVIIFRMFAKMKATDPPDVMTFSGEEKGMGEEMEEKKDKGDYSGTEDSLADDSTTKDSKTEVSITEGSVTSGSSGTE